MALETLQARLRELSIDIVPEFNQGEPLRNGSQWFIGYEKVKRDGVIYRSAFFGDFKRGISQSWMSYGDEQLEPEEIREYEEFIDASKKKAKEDRLKLWDKTRLEVEVEWDSFSDRGESPYLKKKGFSDLYGCRIEPFEKGARTIVPAKDIHFVLWGYQRIFSEKLDVGDKVFRSGARKEGCFHLLGVLKPDSPCIYLCEGLATAATVYDSLGREHPVLACFDAGNLIHVSRDVREKFPEARLIYCADNDQYPAKDGKVYHTGRLKAEKACEEVGNAHVVLPRFRAEELAAKPTDFDDLRQLHGQEEVRRQILEPFADDTGGPPLVNTDDKPTAAMSEARLVKSLLSEFGDNLIRQGRDFFRYTGTHWEHMEPLSAPDYFKRMIDRLASGKLKFKDIQSAYNRFFIHVPMLPDGVSLFSPNPFKQNFRNGTLSLVPNTDGTFKIDFHSHRREDYLVHCHAFDYREDAPPNDEFEAALDRVWANDPDIEAKKAAYYEVLGACLVSAFRKLVVFVGQPKTGKSTLILFAANMVHEKYRCSVDPTLFQGFNLESMAGKLLNYDTDINLVKPITDSILKKVEDRSPMRISRKGISDIYAPIPGMHLFGANRMPVSSEAGQAYDRRMLVFRCAKFQPAGETYTQDFAQHVWMKNPQGIVARAIEGMKRLAANGGHFTVPASSRLEIEAWQKSQGDMVQDFLLDLELGEVSDKNSKVMLGKGLQIEPKHIWSVFKNWGEDSHPRHMVLGKNKFFARLKELGIATKVVKGTHYFEGIGVEAGEESAV